MSEPVEPVQVAVARNPAEAQIWVDALRADGIEAGTYQRGPSAALGGLALGALIDYPVFVAADRVGDARNIIADLGGAANLSALEFDDGERGSTWRWLVVLGGMIGLGILVLVVLDTLQR